LQDAIRSAYHFVVIWTPSASNSEYVGKELKLFREQIGPNRAEPGSSTRMLFQLILGAFESLPEPDIHAYTIPALDPATGPGSMDQRQRAAWEGFVTALCEAVSCQRPNVPVCDQAYDESATAHPLRREYLCKKDFNEGHVVSPRCGPDVLKALTNDQSVAVEGPPGTGKSALAAWINWECRSRDYSVCAFRGRHLQHEPPDSTCSRFENSPGEILIIDDIHLIPSAMERLRSCHWVQQRRFLFLGRAPFIHDAVEVGGMPRVGRAPYVLTPEDAGDVAGKLAKKYLAEHAQTVIEQTRADLVSTKWRIESIVFDHIDLTLAANKAACRMLEQIVALGGDHLRLFLTLAALKSCELSCPERFLRGLRFEFDVMRSLRSHHEIGRSESPGVDGFALELRRHPNLCNILLECGPDMGLVFEEEVVRKTCAALNVAPEAASNGFQALVLGAAWAQRFADLTDLEWALVYSGRTKEYENVACSAALTLCADDRGSPSDLEEHIRRLQIAFASANAARRESGAIVGREMLEQMKSALGVVHIPTEHFAEKGYMLYQDAYLMRLNNEGDAALDRFEESARADELWAEIHDSAIHRAKAAMSRIAAAAYRLDIALLGPSASDAFAPDVPMLQQVVEEFDSALETLESVAGQVQGSNLRQVREFKTNCLIHRAEAAAWVGSRIDMMRCHQELSTVTSGKASGKALQRPALAALAFQEGRYNEVISYLSDGSEAPRMTGGEGTGKLSLMLMIAYVRTGQPADAYRMGQWLLSKQCREDAGNALAKLRVRHAAAGATQG